MAQVDVAVTAGQVAREKPAVEGPAPGAIDLPLGRYQPLFERGRRHHDLEGRSRLIAALDRAILQRPQLVGVERIPGRAVDAGGEIIRVERRQTRERQHFTGPGVEHDGRSEITVGAERVLRGLLHGVVDGQLDAAPLHRRNLFDGADFAAHAVDDHALGAVFTHQQLVVDALDTELSDQRSGGDAIGLHLIFAGLADVADQVRGHFLVGIPAGRHFLDDHVGQLEIKTARRHRRHLRQRRVLDDENGPVARLAAMAIDHFANDLLLDAGHRRQHANRAVEVLGVFADDRDVEGIAVLDQQAAGAVEDDAPRRAQGQRPLVVVLRHLLELGVLHHLVEPEAAGQQSEGDRHRYPQHVQPGGEAPLVFTDSHTIL